MVKKCIYKRHTSLYVVQKMDFVHQDKRDGIEKRCISFPLYTMRRERTSKRKWHAYLSGDAVPLFLMARMRDFGRSIDLYLQVL